MVFNYNKYITSQLNREAGFWNFMLREMLLIEEILYYTVIKNYILLIPLLMMFF